MHSLVLLAVIETLQAVDIEVEPGAARYTITRTVVNDGDEVAEAELDQDLPEGGVIIGVAVERPGGWRPGTLLGAEAAAERYDALMNFGDAPPRPVVLAGWEAPGRATLKVFPVLPRARARVRLEVLVPARYLDGRAQLPVPCEALVSVLGAADDDVRRGACGEKSPAMDGLDDVSAGGWRWLSVPAPAATAEVEPARVDTGGTRLVVRRGGAAGDAQPAFVRWAVAPAGDGQSLARLELDAAAELGALPRRARVVFVIDASITEGPDGIAAELALARAVLRLVPDATADVILFRRRAESMFGGLRPAGEVEQHLAVAAAPAPGNGSDLAAGLSLAARELHAGGPTLIIVMTDGRVPAAELDPAPARAALSGIPDKTIVHVVLRTRGVDGVDVERLDDEPLAPVALATGGILERVEGGPDLAAAALGLVRPVRLDHLHVAGVDGVWDVPATLAEGEGMRRFDLLVPARARALPDELVVSGELWARPVELRVPRDPRLAARLPALAFGGGFPASRLSDAAQAELARRGHVVSPMTSYLADGGDARPSTAGHDDRETACDLCSVGLRGIGTSSHCGGAVVVSRDLTDYAALLAAILRPTASLCLAGALPAAADELVVDATGDEIVDVSLASRALPAAARTCLVEAAWAARLDGHFHRDRQTIRVPLPALMPAP